MEVVKTRLQLQGELTKVKGPYGNALASFIKIYQNEGLPGLQKGLLPAYGYQILLNGTRLGMYEPLKDKLINIMPTGVAMVSSGAISGLLGALFASPLFLVKTVS